MDKLRRVAWSVTTKVHVFAAIKGSFVLHIAEAMQRNLTFDPFPNECRAAFGLRSVIYFKAPAGEPQAALYL